MLFVNEDINDDLFRKAAEDYPLNTEKPDFDAFYKKLNPAAPTTSHRKKRIWLLFLLLIPLFFVIVSRKISSEKNISDVEKSKPGTENPAAITPQRSNNAEPNAVSGLNITTAKSSPGHVGYQSNSVADESRSNTGTGQKHFHFSSKTDLKADEISPTAEDDKDFVAAPAGMNSNLNTKVAIAAPAPQSADDHSLMEKIKSSQTADTLTGALTKKAVATEPENKPSKKEKKPAEKIKSAHFYAGLIGGPDFSAVKMQSLKKVGYSFGIIAGYHVSKRISIETGALKEKKYYRTEGKYFSRKNVNLPAYANIRYASGSCNMTEVPLNIHYVLSNKSHSSKFISAGVSSYFMKNEAYKYDLKYYNYSYSKSFTYANRSTTVSAVINFSAGYTHLIGKAGDLRIEPYVKLPVKKIGTGSLPVQSAGIYIGFTKNIF